VALIGTPARGVGVAGRALWCVSAALLWRHSDWAATVVRGWWWGRIGCRWMPVGAWIEASP